MKLLITLVEKDFYIGAAALVNSIVDNGTYVDKVIIGYKGELPDTLPPTVPSKNGKSFTLNGGLVVELVSVEEGMHIAHQKPEWLLHVTCDLEPYADEYFYFDADIVITRRMQYFGDWVKQGVALCEDVNSLMRFNHPIRKQWACLAASAGLHVTNQVNNYYNGGFIGWTKETKSFIADWVKCFKVLSQKSADLTKFRVTDRTSAVLSANQDSLNLAVMITSLPVSTMGPEAMGFINGFNVMAHAIGRRKPWRKNYLKEFLNGRPPSQSDLLFWQHVNGSGIEPLSARRVKRKIRTIRLFRGLGRFYRGN